MKKIYNYKDGAAFFENDQKIAITQEEIETLTEVSSYNDTERNLNIFGEYLAEKISDNKYIEVKWSKVLGLYRSEEYNFKKEAKTACKAGYNFKVTYYSVNGGLLRIEVERNGKLFTCGNASEKNFNEFSEQIEKQIFN